MSETNLTQPSFSSGILSAEMFSRIDFSKLSSGLKECENWVIRPAGGAVYRVGTEFINLTKHENKEVSLIPFIYNRKDGLCLEFGEEYIRFYKNGKKINYEISTPYLEKDVSEIKYAQYENELYLVHPNYPPKVLKRNSDTDWTLRNMVFNPNVAKVASVTISSDTAKKEDTVVLWDKWQYAVSCVDNDDKEGLPVYSNKISNDIDLLNQPINISFVKPNNVSNIKAYNIYRVKGGEFYFIYRIEQSNNENTLKDTSLAIDTTQSPKEEFTAFSQGNYPSAVGFWNQRLMLGCTKEKPSTIWGSCVDSYEDFTTTPVNKADESFELTFNSGSLDSITDFIPLDDLIVFTQGKIWRVVGTSASNMSAYIESYSGSSGLRPFATKKSILYVDSSLNTVSNFVYSYELNGYVGQNLDILSRDLLDGYTVKDISYRDTPYGVMYSVRSDGVLLGLTYLREENIFAWHKHTTQGYFRNVCSIDKDKNDEVYLVVERGGKRCVEYFKNYIDKTEDIDDSWHLDFARRYGSSWYKWERTSTTSKYFNLYCYTYRTSYDKKIVELPNSYGMFKKASCTISPDESYNDYVYSISMQFENGTLPIIVRKNDTTLTIDQSLFSSDVNDNFNGAAYAQTLNKWLNAIASEVEAGFIWNDKNNETIVSASRAWGSIVAGIDTIFTNDITFEDTGSQLIIKKKGNVLKTFNYEVSAVGDIYVNGSNVYSNNGVAWDIVGNISEAGSNTVKYQGLTYTRNSEKDTGFSESYSETIYKYTEDLPEIGGVAYDDNSKDNPQDIEDVTDDGIVVAGYLYTLSEGQTLGNKEKGVLDADLSYFTNCGFQDVTVLVDTQVYKNVRLVNNKLPEYIKGVNFLIGLSYTGVIETIPNDIKYSSGNTTVGINRKINDGILSFYRTRGLKYGRSIDKLYEIKPYTLETYGENIPLETGKLLLKVADGFSLENSFVVVQDNPLPALIQSITLGETYYGKN